MNTPDPLRTERGRSLDAADALDRLPGVGGVPGRSLLVRVFDGGAMPATVPAYYDAYPVAVDGTPAEGAAPALAPDTASAVVVYVLGPAVPAAGDTLIAEEVGGRWAARAGGVTCPSFLCVVVVDATDGCAYPAGGAHLTTGAGATVHATGPGGFDETGTADASGRWCHEAAAGTYTVVVSKAGRVTRTVTKVVGTACQTYTAVVCIARGVVVVEVVTPCCAFQALPGATVTLAQDGATVGSCVTPLVEGCFGGAVAFRVDDVTPVTVTASHPRCDTATQTYALTPDPAAPDCRRGVFTVTLSPKAGYHCDCSGAWPVPLPDTLYQSDTLLGVSSLPISHDGNGWTGSTTTDYPGCGYNPYDGTYACQPAAGVGVTYYYCYRFGGTGPAFTGMSYEAVVPFVAGSGYCENNPKAGGTPVFVALGPPFLGAPLWPFDPSGAGYTAGYGPDQQAACGRAFSNVTVCPPGYSWTADLFMPSVGFPPPPFPLYNCRSDVSEPAGCNYVTTWTRSE